MVYSQICKITDRLGSVCTATVDEASSAVGRRLSPGELLTAKYDAGCYAGDVDDVAARAFGIDDTLGRVQTKLGLKGGIAMLAAGAAILYVAMSR